MYTVNPVTHKRNTSGLQSYKAPDTKGETVMLGVRVDPGTAQWLKTLEGGVSFHVRQAVRDYYEKKQKEQQV